MLTEVVHGVVVDVCTRSFLLLGDLGSEKTVDCDSSDSGEEFINVLTAIQNLLPEHRIVYADLAVYGKNHA